MRITMMCLLMFSVVVTAAPEHYAFKLGQWQITARAMQPDRTWLTGVGTGHVYLNDVGVVQDELCIDMANMPDVVGATMRTFDPVKQLWHVTWVGLGSASGSGQASVVDDQLVERFTGEDQHGAYVDEMRFIVLNPDHYQANLSRTYQNGNYQLDCIWCYEAKRMAEPDQTSCGLLNDDRKDH